MGIFRSEEFVHKKIRIPRESAGEILNELGKLEDCIEFIDLNKDNIDAKKNFASMINRCEEMEKKIISLERQSESYGLKFFKYKPYEAFAKDLENDQTRRDSRIYGSTYFDLVETEVIEDEKKLSELIFSYTQIEETLDSLYERREVLLKTSQLVSQEMLGVASGRDMLSDVNRYNDDFQNSDFKMGSGKSSNPMIVSDNYPSNQLEGGYQQTSKSDLNFLAGVINADDEMRMKRMIFRTSKGRALTTFWNLDFIRDEENLHTIKNKMNKSKKKKIFTIFFQGGGTENFLQMKILKICDIFSASRYNVPNGDEINQTINNINDEIREKLAFLGEAEGSIEHFLLTKCGDDNDPGKYPLYKLYFRKEKLIYNNLNKCILRDTFIDGAIWIPANKLDLVALTLKNIFNDENRLTANLYDEMMKDSEQKPPTFIQTNDFLWAFQEIVDTYGVPRYQEINPTFFNIVTFPFLFGIMFGDIGHGFILLLFGAYLCLFNSRLEKDETNIFRNMLKGRYILLMMGFFAFYCGFIYNDFFSVPLELFGTCYDDNKESGIAKKREGCVYTFGLDPKWYVSTNELTFFNSLKMKLSVIIGVIHMLSGVLLKGMNAIYFRNMLDFVCEFIPQFIFMAILFGYMDVLIYVKWLTDWTGRTQDAPSLINLMMNIFLKVGSVQGKPVWGGNDVYLGRLPQEWFHLGVLAVAFICVPVMLFVKPIVENRRNKKNSKVVNPTYEQLVEHDDVNASFPNDVPDHPHHSFAEIFIHQVIETIEFVLGAVSNTASYLRLWALSLAHGQLSKVFFQKAILSGITADEYYISIPLLFFGFIIFASVTFFVLMCMDMMECFLHTLRLHWVEFQNKFFKADGYKFKPYSFKYTLDQD